MDEELAVEIDNEPEHIEEGQDAEQSADYEAADETEEGETEDDEGVVVTIEGESPPQEENHAPEWVKELRKNHRELQRKYKELQSKVEATKQPEVVTLGPKPTMDDEDVLWEPEKYEQKLAVWYEQKRKVEEQKAQAEQRQQEEQKAWQARLEEYGRRKANLKAKDFDEAEATVLEAMSQTQQGVILQGAEDPALVVYALGKNPKKAQELASITDPVKFAFAVAKLETKMTVTPSKKAPPPEKTVRGTGSLSAAPDKVLARLEAEAEKTGDRSKIAEYRRQLRKK